jgi:Glycosyl transferases group 1
MTRPRVLMVLSRPYTDNPTTGREKINAFAHASISQIAEIHTEHFRHILATRNAWTLAKAGLRFIQGLFASPYPLQALLFSDQREIQRIESIVQSFKPDVVFIESERNSFLIQSLRNRWPKLRIVCDFDDLMSRRMTEWVSHGNAISFGYMARFIPAPLQKLLAGPLAGSICRYEAASLAALEQQLLELCDNVILLSSKETELLKKITPSTLQSKITLIPPACEPKQIKRPIQPIRFVFIGSDALLQNRLTIEYLIDLWRQYAIRSPLVIYGKMTKTYPGLPISVQFAGFADTLTDVYTDNSILLSPSFVKGGVKTKILEAMEYGTLPIGNAISFEGIADAAAYQLIGDQAQLIAFLQDPATHLDTFLNIGRKISEEASKTMATSIICRRWQACLLPDLTQV